MSSESNDPHSVRLNQVIADYLAAVESGDEPDREELTRRHPDLADDLKSFFADHDGMKMDVQPPTPPPKQANTVEETNHEKNGRRRSRRCWSVPG